MNKAKKLGKGHKKSLKRRQKGKLTFLTDIQQLSAYTKLVVCGALPMVI